MNCWTACIAAGTSSGWPLISVRSRTGAVLSDDGIKPHHTLNPPRFRQPWVSWRDLMKQPACLKVAPDPDSLRCCRFGFVRRRRSRRDRRRRRAGSRPDDAPNHASDLASGHSTGNTAHYPRRLGRRSEVLLLETRDLFRNGYRRSQMPNHKLPRNYLCDTRHRRLTGRRRWGRRRS
jgi:hypothetical protein